jgi:Ca2+-transporting ATPase
MEITKWYQVDVEQAIKTLESDLHHGLNDEQVKEKRSKFGLNELEEEAGKSIWAMFFDQFKEYLVILLFIAAVVSGILGEWVDSIVIMAIVILNAFIGVFQEYKAEKSLAALKRLSAPLAKVIRNGHVKSIPAQELVPGDVIILEAGDFVPADARLIEAVNLKIEEAALTGESVPSEKTNAVFLEELPLGDQKNLVFMGTVVTYGRGKAIVAKTGMNTEIGQIATLLKQAEAEPTPLQQKLEEFGKYLGTLALIVCSLIFILGWLRGENVTTMFLTSVSLAVAAIPEGLPAIVTIVLAIGVQRLAGQKAIIRKLPAVETLGAATVICSDKTGTLTQNQMTVKRVFAGGEWYEVSGQGYNPDGGYLRDGESITEVNDGSLKTLLLCGVLCNDAILEEEWKDNIQTWRIIGDPTEGALVVAAAKAELKKAELSEAYERVLEIPFDSDRKLMTTINKGSLPDTFFQKIETETPKGLWAITKGAPDIVLNRCSSFLTPEGIKNLTPAIKEDLMKRNGEMAKNALRVLGVAVRRMPEAGRIDLNSVEDNLTFIGFWGMIDPPRPEVKDSINECRAAGIKPVMITGDHRDTATAIASELGLLGEGELVMTGQELDGVTDDELTRNAERISVYARVSPQHKVRIVNIFRNKGHVVAMTGDGVNDAPALKRADIGAAMGISGTDVAKSASEMVLADDNFATIVGAVREGRVIYENIKKAVYFLLSCNIGEIFSILFAILFQLPVPLLAIQILWVNLVTDSFPALALGMEPAEPGIMKRQPRKKTEGIFVKGMKLTILVEGFLIGAFTIIAFYVGAYWSGSVEQGRTMAFATLSLSQLFHVFNFRSVKDSIFEKGLILNKFLIGASIFSGLIQLAVMFIPVFQPVFKVVPLDFNHWLIIFVLTASVIPLVEIWKLAFLRRFVKEQ